MSTSSNKSASWLARLGAAFRRRPCVHGARRNRPLRHDRRGLRFESLETRSLLSATVLPTISGIAYEDPTGSGVIHNDYVLPNVTLDLWRDGGDGVFEGKGAGSDDTLVSATTTNANGSYSFSNLTAGTYYIQELPVPGLAISTAQSVQTAVITPSDLQGAMGTMIDSFASTSQFVTASAHGGRTQSSSSASPDAVGGHRNLYAQLTSTGGGVSLGADSDFAGLLDFSSNSASTGTYWVNWDGNNGNAATLNPTGLGGVDLTSQGASTGIEINAADDRTGGTLMLKVYTDANDWSFASVPLTDNSDGSLSAGGSQIVPFSSFAVGGGSGANFTNVGAIQLGINSATTSDGQVGPIQAMGPMTFSENFVNLVEADLSVVKTATPNPAVAGGQLTYTFSTSNNGPSGATGVTLSDTLPAGVTYVSSSGQGTVTNNNGTLAVQLGSLAAGAADSTSIVVAVSSSASGSITNTVTVTGDQPDPNLSNNTSTVTTQVAQSVDLALVKTAAPNPVTAGNQLTYTLTATDNGPSNATGVTIVDTLPAGTTYVSSNGGSATISGQTVTLSIGNLADGASATSTIVVTVGSSVVGTIINTAVVSGNQPDPNLANNTASAMTQVNQPVHQQAFTDLKIVKTAQPNPVSVGNQLTYTLVVSNNSLTTATGVTVVDTLPVGFSYLSATGPSLVQSSLAGNTLTLNLGTLTFQASDTITILGTVTSAAASTITNTATVSSNEPDANPADNRATVTTTVITPHGSKFFLLGR
jgi:large repetitive protein